MENNSTENNAAEPMPPYGSDFTDPKDPEASSLHTSPSDHIPASGDDFKGYGAEDLLEKAQPEELKEPEIEGDTQNIEETGAWFGELERFDDPDQAQLNEETVEPFDEDTGFFEGHWTKTKSPLKSTPGQLSYQEKGWQREQLPESDPDSMSTIPPDLVETPSEVFPSALPQPVAEIDPSATMLNQVAFAPTHQPGQAVVNPAGYSQPVPALKEDTQPMRVAIVPPPKGPKPPKQAKKKHSGKPWLVVLVIFLIMLFGVGAFGVYKYIEIARTLPDVNTLRTRASQFETTRILDRNGNILYEIMDPNAGKRTYVPLDRISPYLIGATLATEDKEYYNHPGFDLVALARALYTNYTSGEIISGASTITQQLAETLVAYR